jgi:uncharacterized protein (TIGR02099 family)
MRAKRSLLKKILAIALASLIILAGLGVAAAVLLTYLAPHYRQALAQRFSAHIDGTVAIGALSLSWSLDGPQLDLSNVRVTRCGARQPAVTVRRVDLYFSYLALLAGKRLPEGIILNAPRASFARTANGRLRLVHWTRPAEPRLNLHKLEALRSKLDFVRVHNARIQLFAPALPNGQATLYGLDAALDNGNNQHWRIALTTHGPAWWPYFDLHAGLTGPLDRLRAVTFDSKARDVSALVLADAKQHLGKPAGRLSGGRVDTHIHGHWHHHGLANATVQVTTTALQRAHQAQPVLPALHAVVQVTGGAPPGHLRFTLTRIHGALPGLTALKTAGQINRHPLALALSARHVPGALAADLARLRFPALKNTAIALGIDHLQLHASADRPLTLALDFNDLKVNDPRVAFGPVSGHYAQRGSAHVLTFTNAGGALTSSRYIKGRLAINGLSGTASWQRVPDGLRIEANDLALHSRKARLNVSGHARIPDKGSPVVDLTAAMKAPDIARLLCHLPQAPDLPNPKLRRWLATAVMAGTLDSAHLNIAGALERFPFTRPRAGEHSHLTMRLHGVDIHYKPGWPALKNARGTLALDNGRLDARLDRARLLDVTLAPSSVHIADVRAPVLHINGHVRHGHARQLLAFLSHSPLKRRFGAALRVIDLHGIDDVSTRLRIPLKSGLGQLQVTGTATVHNNTLRQSDLPVPITQINGQIAFNNKGLNAHDLRGNLRGAALRADIKPGGAYQRITADVTLALPRDRPLLAYYLPKRWLDYLHGRTSARIAFRAQKGGISNLRITSELAGLGIDLPTPLHKRPARRAPITVHITPDARHIEAEYDHRLHLAIRQRHGVTTRIQALLGNNAPKPPDADGLWLGGHVKTVDGLGWFYVVRHILYGAPTQIGTGRAPAGQSTGSGSALSFRGGDLTIGALHFKRRYVANTHIRIRSIPGIPAWHVDLAGPNSQGQLTWTDPAHGRMGIAGRFALLALDTAPKRPKNKNKNQDQDSQWPVLWADVSPLELPRLQLYARQFKIDGIRFGRTYIDAAAPANGWILDRFGLLGGALTGEARARWIRKGGLTTANVRADFHGHGLSRLLHTFGYSWPLRARSGQLHGRLAIAPNPNGLDLRALSGHLHLALDHGTLLSVNPGPARLLGLLNLDVLPRRLRLNFRDVVDKGLAFTKVRADFNIENGNAFNKNALVETAPAKITLAGRIGLAARDYNEQVTITPKIGGSMAIASALGSALLGGPLIGAIVFGIQELLAVSFQTFSGIGYTLKGSWTNPILTKFGSKK